MQQQRSMRPPRQGEIIAEGDAQGLVEQCLDQAGSSRASDVHFEPQADKFLIRFRVDGSLQVWKEMPLGAHSQIVARLKVMASMDISEKRMPQDGRFTRNTAGGLRDYRISTTPMMEGEKAVVRVLHEDLSKLTIHSIGYTEHNLREYSQLLQKPHGLLLHCGPTGSGKTTALYASINGLSQTWRNVSTIEDPVEGRLNGVNQAQVNPEIGLTFASVLRAYLRQDCDVILVGEIRDPETAQLAVQASLTGHLVLGTLHTNSAAGAVSRLMDMGVPNFFLAAGLIGVVSQRLVRRLCNECRQPIKPTADQIRQYNLDPNLPLQQATGCRKCANQGYRGRIGIQEVLVVTPQIREAIQQNPSEGQLQELALRGGMVNMFRDGVSKAAAGVTTVEEIYNTIVAERL